MVFSNRKIGYIYIIVGVSLYAFSDAIMQYYMRIYGVNQVTFFRTITRFAPLLIFAWYKAENPLKTSRVKENIFRAVLASLGTYFFMLAYKHTAMTNVIVVGYSTALFMLPFSVFILKEKLYKRDIFAVCIGFVGVVLSFRPGVEILQFGVIYAGVGALIAALNQVIIKRLASTDSELTIISYHHITLLLISVIIGFESFIAMSEKDIYILSLGGFIGAAAQYCIIKAFKLLSCSNLASATYVMLIPVTLIDYVVYGKIPDFFIIGGLLLIIAGNHIAIRRKKTSEIAHRS